ncbi:ycf3-interacting protein 1, chloroplastic isoform X3 [Beta vulgaris subsp. vulgaris]|uniref:ycf3-interacting protein 1, chloroplastic isoform X3 n=1 Tax=Beta vulgaris subsp. vulgaris TaxID=3555 RepID=UPI00203737AE|nr:ycf3-interacting protein 1, chloroplastic isoform X3 [Beta vulgaris subsp. vulgaris]
MVSQSLQLPLASSSSAGPSMLSHHYHLCSSNIPLFHFGNTNHVNTLLFLSLNHVNRRYCRPMVQLARVSMNDSEAVFPTTGTDFVEEELEPTPEDLECISEIKRVLELLRKNRDMIFGEVNDGKIPRNRFALRMLAEELTNWPNLEVAPKKTTKSRSLYAKATDTGIDPKVAAKRLNVDWDSAAEIEAADTTDDTEVPKAVVAKTSSLMMVEKMERNVNISEAGKFHVLEVFVLH